MLLSIIIPIYKVENYIESCLESVLCQINDEVEVICVNDGSPDLSMEVARNYVERVIGYSGNIIFIEQNNKGLSGARNTGLKHAKGEYIAFLDSDDKFSSDYISEIFYYIKNEKPDIIEFNIVRSNGQVLRTRNRGKNKNLLINIFKSASWYACARVYRTDFIENYRFIEGIYYEDVALIPKLYIKANNIIYLDKELYWYRVNEEGITLSVSEPNNKKTVDSLELIMNYYLNLYAEEHNFLYSVVAVQCFYILSLNCCRRYGFLESYKVIKHNINSFHMTKACFFKSLSFKSYFFIRLPVLYIFFYFIYRKVWV